MSTEISINNDRPDSVPVYDWHYILQIAAKHRREITLANSIAILATITSVPVPLLLPLLVDEVLLDKPGIVVNTINSITPAGWHTPVLYITAFLFLAVILRLTALILNVWQARQFSVI